MQVRKWSEAREIIQTGLSHYNDDLGLYWLLGESELQEGHFKEALKSYHRIQKTTGETGPAKKAHLEKRLGQCYTQLGTRALEGKEKKEALQHFKEANRYLKGEAFSHLNLTLAYGQVGEWVESLNTAKKGLLQFPKHLGLIKAKATALYQLKNYEDLPATFKSLYELQPDDLNVAVTYGELLMSSQQYVKAAEHYDELLKKHPKEKGIYESLINIHESKLYYDGKVQVLNRMLDYFDKVEVYERIAKTYESLENWSITRAYYDTLTGITPRNISYPLKRAITYVEEGSLPLAVRALKKVDQNFPNEPTVIEELGRVQEQAGLWSEALVSYQRLLSLNASPKVFTRLGTVNHNLGSDNIAIHFYRKALGLENNIEATLGLSKLIRATQADSSISLAYSAFQLSFDQLEKFEDQLNNRLNGNNGLNTLISNKELLENIKEAETLATESFYHLSSYSTDHVDPLILNLTHSFPNSGRIHYLVGEYQFKHRRKEESLNLLTRSVELDPNSELAHNLLGELYVGKDEQKKAILSFERSLALNNEQPTLYGQLIDLYQDTGQLDLLCQKWLIRYEASQKKDLIKPHLIEALHKAGRYEEAKQIIQGS